jgi:methylenetetrahydrofolate reductase (NADPH)
MKIVDKIALKKAEGKPFYSFEYFPPKTAQVSGDDHLRFGLYSMLKFT